MAWSKTVTSTTKHTCGGPVFGKKTPGCPRCDELLSGAKAVTWGKPQYPVSTAKHDCKVSRCAVVCTFGDW